MLQYGRGSAFSRQAMIGRAWVLSGWGWLGGCLLPSYNGVRWCPFAVQCLEDNLQDGICGVLFPGMQRECDLAVR
jgi:hypothetical protein